MKGMIGCLCECRDTVESTQQQWLTLKAGVIATEPKCILWVVNTLQAGLL